MCASSLLKEQVIQLTIGDKGAYLYAVFGAPVAHEDDNQRVLTLVGDDEQDASAGKIGWSAPLARALRGAALGDLRRVVLPGGEKEWEVLAISYPEAD